MDNYGYAHKRNNGSTVVAFAQTNGTAIADIMTCPQLITPDLSGSEPLFAMEDLIWEWDSAFDANAVIAVMGSWNELMDEDVEAMFVRRRRCVPTARFL